MVCEYYEEIILSITPKDNSIPSMTQEILVAYMTPSLSFIPLTKLPSATVS
jgi:hypothetical protein